MSGRIHAQSREVIDREAAHEDPRGTVPAALPAGQINPLQTALPAGQINPLQTAPVQLPTLAAADAGAPQPLSHRDAAGDAGERAAAESAPADNDNNNNLVETPAAASNSWLSQPGLPQPAQLGLQQVSQSPKSKEGPAIMTAARFHFPNHPNHQNQTPPRMLFIPHDHPMTHEGLQDIASKAWKLDAPNLLITLDAGTAHPTVLGTQLLTKQKQFRRWRRQARKQAELQDQRRGQNIDGSPLQPTLSPGLDPISPPDHRAGTGAQRRPQSRELQGDSKEAKVINALLYSKLVSVLVAVIDSAALSNNWIVIDRTDPNGSSATAELLLEMALRQTDTRPTILVIDSFQRLEKMAEYQKKTGVEAQRAVLQLDQLKDMRKGAVPHPASVPPAIQESLSLYVPRDFEDHAVFKALGLPAEPFDEHIQRDSSGKPKYDSEERPVVSDKRYWLYHYQQYLFSSGTHYLVVDRSDQKIKLDTLAPQGCIFAHGGTKMAERMRLWITRGKPCVMLFNSGGVTQAWGSIHNEIVKKHVYDTAQIMEEMQIVSAENWALEFGMSEIMTLLELNQRAPLLLRKTVVVVNVIEDNAETVLEMVTGCFASTQGGVPELGLGTAEMDVIREAWRQHICIFGNAARQKKIADWLFHVSIVLTELTALASVVYLTLLRHAEDKTEDWAFDALQYLVVVLPILTGLLTTIVSRQRTINKWSTLYLAANEIVSEIYKYRTRVEHYDSVYTDKKKEKDKKKGRDEDEAEAGAGASGGHSASAHRARFHFVRRVQTIFDDVTGGDMAQDALQFGNTDRVLELNDDEVKGPEHRVAWTKAWDAVVRRHVTDNLLDKNQQKERAWETVAALERKRRESEARDGGAPATGARADAPRGSTASIDDGDADAGGATHTGFDSLEVDDFVSPMTVESYVHFRVRPLFRRYQSQSPRLSWSLWRLELLGFIVTTAGTLLAVLKLQEWVTFSVVSGSVVVNVIAYQGLQNRLAASNQCLRDLQNLLTWWEAASLVDRRTRNSKTLCVSTTENAVLSEVSAWTVTQKAAMKEVLKDEEEARK